MKIIGHRGARGLAPENTIAGLRKALDHHVDMIEFDLCVTHDNVVILHHDPDLTDPNGTKHRIINTSFKELKRHKPDLTTFEEVLKTFASTVPLYAEVKSDVPVAPIVTIIKKYPSAQLFLASKSQKILLALHAALPKIPKIVIEPWSGVRAHRRASQVDTKLVAMNQRWLWWGFIRGFKNSDWQLYTYTLNDPGKAKRWARWGLAGVITDNPDRFEK